MFETVAIWGVGLLGGSLGLALRERGLAGRVIGIGRNPERLAAARAKGLCDETTLDAAEGLRDADLAVLCAPVSVIAQMIADLAPLFKDGAIVTDVGSTKRRIVEAAERAMPPDRHFVGSHPMSGAEKSGLEHARADLYEGNACFLTPTADTNAEALAELGRLWSALGSRIIITDPARHDEIVAGISHAPHLASSALAHLALALGEEENFLSAVAGNGFWDMTRLAEGDPGMWREICAENRDAIGAQLERLIDALSQARRRLAAGEDLGEWLEQAREARLEWRKLAKAPEHSGGSQ